MAWWAAKRTHRQVNTCAQHKHMCKAQTHMQHTNNNTVSLKAFQALATAHRLLQIPLDSAQARLPDSPHPFSNTSQQGTRSKIQAANPKPHSHEPQTPYTVPQQMRPPNRRSGHLRPPTNDAKQITLPDAHTEQRCLQEGPCQGGKRHICSMGGRD